MPDLFYIVAFQCAVSKGDNGVIRCLEGFGRFRYTDDALTMSASGIKDLSLCITMPKTTSFMGAKTTFYLHSSERGK